MVSIVDYGVGNLNSVKNMLRKAGVEAIITGDPAEIAAASKILLPGMGHFDNCMIRFHESGLRPLIESQVFEKKIPVLGICVGLQMFMDSSEEGVQPGLGWIKGRTVRFRERKMDAGHKIPNMGWQDLKLVKPSVLMKDLDEARFYFAHSYHVEPEFASDKLLQCNYGYEFTAGIERDNIVGVQFHPEKSHRFGMQLLKNFALNY
jgi:glutamine amidotransferase